MAASGWREDEDREPKSSLPSVVVTTLQNKLRLAARFAGRFLQDAEPRVRTRSVLWHRSDGERPADMRLSEFMNVVVQEQEKEPRRMRAGWRPRQDAHDAHGQSLSS